MASVARRLKMPSKKLLLQGRHFCLDGMMLGGLKKLAEANYVDVSDLKTKQEIVERLQELGITKKSRITKAQKAVSTFGGADREIKKKWIAEHIGEDPILHGEHLVDPSTALHNTIFLCLYFADFRMKDLFTVNIVGAWQSYANHTEESKRDVSICFVSGDEYEEGFAESDEIPFLRLPFSSKEIRGKLHDNFQITGYPGLIVVNLATGEVVTRDGCRQLFKLDRIENMRDLWLGKKEKKSYFNWKEHEHGEERQLYHKVGLESSNGAYGRLGRSGKCFDDWNKGGRQGYGPTGFTPMGMN